MLLQTEKDNAGLWLTASEASSLSYDEVAERLRVDVRKGLSWQEATERRKTLGYVYYLTIFLLMYFF